MKSRTKIANSRRLLLTLAEYFDASAIPYFVDSGSLLGIVRDGDLIPYDSDIDIGVFDRDLERLLGCREALRERGMYLRASSYRGSPYTLSFGWRWRRHLPLHAHVYTHSGGFWWSPQIVKHLKWPGAVRAIMAVRGHAKRTAAIDGSSSPHLSEWSHMVGSRVSLPTFPLYTLAELAMRGLGRADRYDRATSRVGRLLYSRFTWVVPDGFFEELSEIDWLGTRLKVPREPERYLAYRYGDDWRAKKPSWIYLLDDPSIFPEGPETLVPRLTDEHPPVSDRHPSVGTR